MTPWTAPATVTTEWAAGEGRALRRLRARYRRDRDLFTAREHARLCFLRWLVHAGHLVP